VNLHKMKKVDIIWAAEHTCKHRHSYLDHPRCFDLEHPAMRGRRGYLDIETFGLDASFGVMLSWCLKPAGDSHILHDVFTSRDITREKPGEEDRRIVASVVDAIRQFDLIITHYGNDWRFDMPFVRTRACAMHIPFPEYGRIRQLDTYPILKSKFRLKSNRQEHAVRALLGKTEKTHVEGHIWRAAMRGDKKALSYVLDHNRRDVRDLERLWDTISVASAERSTRV